MSVTYPDGTQIKTEYDILGSVVTLTDYDGAVFAYTCDAEGRTVQERYPGGSASYAYNAAGQLAKQVEYDLSGAVRRQTDYTYDAAGNLVGEARTGVEVERRSQQVQYAYDVAGQLISYSVDGAATQYQYDAAGNLLSDGENTYTYDVQNRLLSKTGPDGASTYEYDAAGNLVKETTPDGAVTYIYNAQNRLIKGEWADGQSSSYTYNALGTRTQNVQVRKNENAGYQHGSLKDGSHETDYLDYLTDGRATWQRAWETEVGTTVQNDFETVTKHYVVDYLSAANRDILVTEDGSFIQRYVYDETGARISGEFSYADGTARGSTNAAGEYGENLQSDFAAQEIQKVYYRTNILGSGLFAVDRDGDVISHTVYDPWGSPQTDTYPDANYSGLDNTNNFTGYTWDEVLDLYFAQNRFYDPANHRFTQEDIIKDGQNWYVYCGNEPVRHTDPSGNVAGIDDLILLGAVSVVGAAAIVSAMESYLTWAHSTEGQRVIGAVSSSATELIRSIADSIDTLKENVEKVKEYFFQFCCGVKAGVQAKVDEAVKTGKPDRNWYGCTVYVHYDTVTAEVYYVGRTNDFDRRYYEHSRTILGIHVSPHPVGDDIQRQMMPVVTGLTENESKIVEQVLISAFTLDALDNARNEFRKKRWDKAINEVDRAMELFGGVVDLDDILP